MKKNWDLKGESVEMHYLFGTSFFNVGLEKYVVLYLE